MTPFTFVVPAGVRDPAHPSGGNRYDLELAAALRGAGWRAHVLEVAPGGLAAALAQTPPAEPVLIDGLVLDQGGGDPDTDGHRLIALLHMPPTHPRTISVLDRGAAVITTSAWTRDRLRAALPAAIAVARPGVRPVRMVSTSPGGRRLRCVGALTRQKGQDVLAAALGRLRELAWRCELVGAADRDPAYTDALVGMLTEAGVQDRVTLAGARHGNPLDAVYAGADVLVVPSREESYGMAAAEALACGIPVIAADTGGIREAVVPGAALLVPPENAGALANALRAWLCRPELRRRMTAAARATSDHRRRWSSTASIVAEVLDTLPAHPAAPFDLPSPDAVSR